MEEDMRPGSQPARIYSTGKQWVAFSHLVTLPTGTIIRKRVTLPCRIIHGVEAMRSNNFRINTGSPTLVEKIADMNLVHWQSGLPALQMTPQRLMNGND